MLNAIIPAFGLFVGSFLNICIDRLPHNKSMNPLNLSCPSCLRPIKLYERIPVLGYILSKGKCTQCNASVSIRYPVIEVAAAFVLFFFFRKYGLSLESFTKTFLVLMLILISFIDLNFRTIPDVLSIGGLAVGLVLAFFRKPFFYYQDALYGVFLCGGILFAIAFCCQIFFKKEILGLGDIMLLSMIGAFCGLKGAVFSFLAGSLLGTLVGIPVMLKKGKDTKYAIPFGPFLSLGALFYMSFGDKFVYAFLRLLSGSAI